MKKADNQNHISGGDIKWQVNQMTILVYHIRDGIVSII